MTHINQGNQRDWCTCPECHEPAIAPNGFCRNCGAEVFSAASEVG